MDTVEPIFAGTCSGAAADRFEIDPEVPIPWIDPGKARRRARAVAGSDASLRYGLRQCADHQIGGALAGTGAAIDGGRMHGVHHGAEGGRYGDWAGQAGIRRDRRIDHRLDRVIHTRQERRVDHVDAGAHLWWAVEMQSHLAALDRNLDRYVERAAKLGTVVGV